MMRGGLDALRQIIREKEPLRPSTKLNTLPGEAGTTAGKRRQTDVSKLVHQLQGDLDWIVMKCLEKDRTRRYETANGLAADVQRHLHDEPVTPAAPSAAYRLRKFARRNRAQVFAAGAVAAALLIGVIACGWQAAVGRDQRGPAGLAQKSEAEQRKVADAARADAETEQAEAMKQEAEATKQEAEARKQEAEAKKQAAIPQAVARVQTDTLAAAAPQNLLGDKVTVVQTMEAAVKKLD